MPELSRITLPSGNTYTFKDEIARSITGGGMTFRGVTSTVLTDESLETEYEINNVTMTAANGDFVIYNRKEFVYSTADSMWHELGDNSVFGDLAYSSSIPVVYTPGGSVSQPLFTGAPGEVSVSGTPSGTVSISTGNGVANYTPEGSISKPSVSVTLDTSTGYVAESSTAGGSVSAGTPAQCVLPQLSMTVTGETLNIGWSAGSFTANTPTQVTMPSFVSKTIASGVETAALDAAPIFSGTAAELKATFTGTSMNSTGNFTPEGSVSQPTFQGTQATIVVEPSI